MEEEGNESLLDFFCSFLRAWQGGFYFLGEKNGKGSLKFGVTYYGLGESWTGIFCRDSDFLGYWGKIGWWKGRSVENGKWSSGA